MTRKLTAGALVLLMGLMLLLNIAAGAETAAAGLSIDLSTLSASPTFVDWEQDGVAMQLIALLDADGNPRLAFNTCQSCGGSPYAWFEDLGNGALQCQNCGLTFPLDTVGTEKAQGCNPVTIADFTVEGDTVTVPEALLKANAERFANWKHFD